MKKAMKGALLSGLVFPGAGHLFLKRYKMGIALMAIAIVSMTLIVAKAVQQAFITLEKVQAGVGTPDINALANATTQATAADPVSNIATFFLIICWCVGIVDAYVLGRRKDREASPANPVNDRRI